MFDRSMNNDVIGYIANKVMKEKIEEIKDMIEKVDFCEVECVYNYLRNRIAIEEENEKEINDCREIFCTVRLFGDKEVRNILCSRCNDENIELYYNAVDKEGKKAVLDSLKDLTPAEREVLKNTKIWLHTLDID